MTETASRPTPRATALADGWTVVLRNLIYLRRVPTVMSFVIAYPIIMLLLFGYVLGGSISLPGGEYRQYLVSGLFGMIALTGVTGSLSVVAADAQRGVADRFRCLPMSRLAVPFGHAGSDIITGAIGLACAILCGLAVGWRAHRGVAMALAAFALLVLFRYAMTWVGVYLGMCVRNEEAAGYLSTLLFPVSMIANTIVPTHGMPGWVREIADWNPLSSVVAACRRLFGDPAAGVDHAWPLDHPIIATFGWCALLLAVFVPLAVRRYHGGDS